ncbi:DUF2835 family protein [Marinospirillum alkaliphilum]|uniref:DUF2835 domain-containing protein n=1 Tax=Marinospirillum alkaliphilum DSM 21637 TaxID=1122209 RepID=A0A1K1YFF4_9GAMM|nr:DUF2835 family protein [Marinospirillum alkaliphilum]SFX60655.1 Protein of unknown function [Marinospirillum alkaliphilum DSM 21637]
MPSVYVRIKMSAAECLAFYTSQAPNVKTTTVDGRSIIFPRRIIRQMVDQTGINGLFRLNYSDTGQFLSIERVSN